MADAYGLKYSQLEDLRDRIKAGQDVITGEGLPLEVTPKKEGQLYLDTIVGELWISRKSGAEFEWVNVAKPLNSNGETTGIEHSLSFGTCYPNWELEYVSEFSDGCTVGEVDVEKLDAFVEEHKSDEPMGEDRVEFEYREGYWVYQVWGHGMEEVKIRPEDMLSTTGIQVTLNDPTTEFARFNLQKKISIDTSVSPVEFRIPTEAYLETFCFRNQGANIAYGYYVQRDESDNLSYTLTQIPSEAIYNVYVQGTVATTPNSFLSHCTNLNNAEFYSKAIGDSNLEFSTFVSATVYGDSVTKIGDTFMQGATCTGSGLSFSLDDVTEIGGGFCNGVKGTINKFEAPRLEKIGDSFFASTSINVELDLPSLKSVESFFLGGCREYNQPLYLPNLISVDNQFLYNCSSLNKPVIIPNLVRIGRVFMSNCSAFNQPLTFNENCAFAPKDFLNSCTSFNQDIKLPQRFLPLDRYTKPNILQCVSSMTSVVDLGDLPTPDLVPGIPTPFNGDAIFTALNTSDPAYQTGITLKGTNVDAWITMLPNKSTSTCKRKLINGGPSPSA